jgi:hypothetical protein
MFNEADEDPVTSDDDEDDIHKQVEFKEEITLQVMAQEPYSSCRAEDDRQHRGPSDTWLVQLSGWYEREPSGYDM